jgi:ankyrin repeat protein
MPMTATLRTPARPELAAARRKRMRKADLAAGLLAAVLAVMPLALPAGAQSADGQSESDGRVLSEAEMLLAGAEANRIDVILVMLNKGVDANARAKGGYTALIAAAGNGSMDALDLLLARGARVNMPTDEGWTALMEAVAREQEEAARRLLRAGADVAMREKRHGSTVLMVAARTDTPALVSELLANGADPNVSETAKGLTPLHLALSSQRLRSVEAVGELLVAGADPAKAARDGYTPLMSAAESGMLDKLSLILSEKVDVTAVTQDGRTALTVAAAQDKPELVRRLLASGANAEPPEGQMTPLAAAIRAGSLECARLMIDAGAGLDRSDADGRLPLTLAVLAGQDEILEMLLERGSDPNGRNMNDGSTALMWAANTGRKSYIELLLEKGADAGIAANDGWTAGEAARMAGHDELARLLERRI